ncbi:MAG TPA: ATP synthase F1 subunit gamma [Phycisphaerae bacterium]|nr:ATP synthase F1 subunit gamma [Phycisphaerae bacterium]
MAKTRTMVKRMRAVRNIRTVSKAMQTVAAARFKLANDRIGSFSPYGNELVAMVGDLIARSESEKLHHPLLREPEGFRHDVLLVLTSSRGLCGSYNSAVLKLTIDRLLQLRQAEYEVELHVVGYRGIRYLEFRGLKIDKTYDRFGDLPTYEQVSALADSMTSDFLARRISGMEVAYMQFVSAGQQRPAVAQLLPLADLPSAAVSEEELALSVPYDFYPRADEILRKLLPETVRLKLYQCFLDAGAAEQLMRRAAMRAATDNADDMIHELRQLINRQRQMQITTELSEIMGGGAGLEQKA